MDQVGVNAPGNPNKMTDLSLQKSETLYFLGGNPWCNSTPLGILSPTDAKLRLVETAGTFILAATLRAIVETMNVDRNILQRTLASWFVSVNLLTGNNPSTIVRVFTCQITKLRMSSH